MQAVTERQVVGRNEKMPSRERGASFMGYIRGEAREQTTTFPVTLAELIPATTCAG
jgi:hypothetical protein